MDGAGFAGDVARVKQWVPLVSEAAPASLTALGERFVISHSTGSTMLIGQAHRSRSSETNSVP